MQKELVMWSGIILFLSTTTAWLSEKVDTLLGWPTYQSIMLSVIGACFVVLGLWMRYAGTREFCKHHIRVVELRAQEDLVTSGIFHWSRNPLVLGITFIFLGISLMYGSTTALIAVLLFQLFWCTWIRCIEEPSLRKVFGQKYDEYMKTVPRWIRFPHFLS